ncbi:hypothetical protein D3C75_818960 [compost metagenome]
MGEHIAGPQKIHDLLVSLRIRFEGLDQPLLDDIDAFSVAALVEDDGLFLEEPRDQQLIQQTQLGVIQSPE